MSKSMILIRSLLKKIATFFGVGLCPIAPGTMGTLAAIPLAMLTLYLGPFIHMIACILLLPISILAAQIYERDKNDGHDPSEVVIDEVMGFLITMTWQPWTWQSYALGLLVFRFLDITKPFPINYLDKKVPGGVGIVMDDVAAGII